MLGTLQVPARKHVDITAALKESTDYFLDLKALKDGDANYNMTIMGILIEHDGTDTSEVRGVLYDDMDRNIGTFRLLNNIPQWLAFRHIYKAGTDRTGRRIKILGA